MPQNNSANLKSRKLEGIDPIWDKIREEAKEASSQDRQISGYMYSQVLSQKTLEKVLSVNLAKHIETIHVEYRIIEDLFDEFYSTDKQIQQTIRADISAVFDRDPACHRYIEPILYFKGFQALICYRLSHHLWYQGRKDFACYLQSLVSERFGVDIHPAAKIGCGILLDHATSFVAGETAVIEDNVSILHEVTLGGTGKERGDRHPKIKSGVLLGAGAKILGNVTIGECAKIGAGSVVVKDVPPHKSVAGVPAVIVGHTSEDNPALGMCQMLDD